MDTSADGGNSFRVVKTLRLARTLRGVRVIRLFRYFSVLWLESWMTLEVL